MGQVFTTISNSHVFAQSSATLTREVFGNISPLSKLIFYLLALVSMALFFYGIWRKVKRWRIGKKLQNLKINWKRLFSEVLLQRRVLHRGLASVAHLMLFSGFLVLFIGTLLIAAEHVLASVFSREASNPVFHYGIYYAIYEVVLDTFGVLFLIGTCLFIKRRMTKPASLGHNAADWLILISFLLIGLTGFLTEAVRIIQQQTVSPGYSFVGYSLANLLRLSQLDQAAAGTLHLVLWWIHAVLALVLIAAFPYTRLFHSIAGVVSIAIDSDELGAMRPVSIEEVEETGKFGVAQLADFRFDQLVQLDACVSCGRCEEACPSFAAGKPLSPKAVVQDLKSVMIDQHHETMLVGEVISEETIWACTTCSACQDVCPLRVNPLQMITDLRRTIIGEGQLRGNAASTLQKIQRSGNPWAMPQNERFDWAEGLDVPTVQSNPEFDVLYWVGCSASYDRRVQKVAQAVVRLLKLANVSFACLGKEERCTAETARRLGDEFVFQELAETNLQSLEKYNVKKIVTHCPHCLNSFKQDYPQVGGDFEVIHHTQFLSELLCAGKFQLNEQSAQSLQAKITMHDPCYLARVNEVTEEPRQLIQLRAENLDSHFVELPRAKENTSCCGAGGGRMWIDDDASQRIGIDRVEEVIATGADTLAVACPFCMIMMKDGLAAKESAIEVRDVAEIFADALLKN